MFPAPWVVMKVFDASFCTLKSEEGVTSVNQCSKVPFVPEMGHPQVCTEQRNQGPVLPSPIARNDGLGNRMRTAQHSVGSPCYPSSTAGRGALR